MKVTMPNKITVTDIATISSSKVKPFALADEWGNK